MSDEDTDWGTSSDEEQDVEPQQVSPPSPIIQPDEPLAVEGPVGKVVLVGVPAQLQLKKEKKQKEAPPAVTAGLVVMYDGSSETFSLYAYDASDSARGYILEPWTVDKAKTIYAESKPTAKLTWTSFSAKSWHEARVVITNTRDPKKPLTWTLTFTSAAVMLRVQCILLLGEFCTRIRLLAETSSDKAIVPYAYSSIWKVKEDENDSTNKKKSKKKTCKEGYTADMLIRSWRVYINAYKNLAIPSHDHVRAFAPSITDTHSDLNEAFSPEGPIQSLKVACVSSTASGEFSGCPLNMAELIAGMAQGASRLVIVPCVSPLVQHTPLLRTPLSEVPLSEQLGSVYVLMVNIRGIKKGVASEKKKKTTEEGGDHDDEQQQIDQKNTEVKNEDTATVVLSSHEGGKKKKMKDIKQQPKKSISESLEMAVADLNASYNAVPRLQVKLLQTHARTLMTAIAGLENIDDSTPAVIGEMLRGVIEQFKELNGNTHDSLMTFKQANKAITRITKLAELSTQKLTDAETHNRIQQQSQSNKGNSSSSKAESRLQSLQSQLASVEQELLDMQTKHNDTDAALMKLREQQMTLLNDNTKLTADIKIAKQETQLVSVFEQGMKDMRVMLDKEMVGHREAKEALSECTAFQQAKKNTWVPSNAYNHCLQCHVEFDSTEHAQRWCRHCGRLYCRECCNHEDRIPAIYGDLDVVFTCDRCHQYLSGGD